MVPSEKDSSITRDVKTAIREDLKHRYTSPPALQEYLHRTTALDPRFKSLSHLDLALCLRTYSDLTTETVSSLGTADCEEGQAAPTGADTSPPQKKSAMAELFGNTFVQKDMGSKTFADTIKEQVASYEAEQKSLLEQQRNNFSHLDSAQPLQWKKCLQHKRTNMEQEVGTLRRPTNLTEEGERKHTAVSCVESLLPGLET
ncbi:uncharacterized protein LOC134624967 isoform X2 [Pelmatolapia mariae]|uniref:uncharacterized protein LOC134624967 isoform X2 n=1 Tax=Pelmatolapia mariae TaxID=158779 RepID=UPI002FE635F9